jgi:DNA protecting protein DprA
LSDDQGELPLFSPDRWVKFAVRALPGINAESYTLWRATLKTKGVTPVDWLHLSKRRRIAAAPLPDTAEEMLAKRAEALMRLCRGEGAGRDLWVLAPMDSAWPTEGLAVMGNASPDWLLGWGNPRLMHTPNVAVVGSRETTPEALQVAEIIGRSLVELGFDVVSGGARGVDQTAQQAALRAGGRSLYLLAEGIARSQEFQSRADHDPERVCLLSAQWPFARFSTAEAMRRNRLIVALARAVIVVAARSSGGSVMTGQTALDFDRPTLVVDHGEITVHTAGNHRLLQAGAKRLSAELFAAGHAPAELRQALEIAAIPPPRTGDLFGEDET